jgi:hypothetical protein
MSTVRRSPNYPYIKLGDAINKLNLIYEHEDDHFAPVDAIASHWKMSTTSSSLGKVIGALLQYNLIEEKGSGDGRHLKVSSLGLDILLREEDDDMRIAALKKAALAPKIHRELWDKYDGRLPKSDQSLRIYLLKDREEGVFNKDRVDAFLASFRATLAYSGLTDGDTIGDEKQEIEQDNEQPIESQVISEKQAKMLDIPIVLPTLRMGKISLPKDMNEAEFQFLLDMLTVWKGAIVKDSPTTVKSALSSEG